MSEDTAIALAQADEENSARRWWPAEWLDEVMPPSRPSPDAWLVDADGHFYIGYRLDADDVREHDKRYYQKKIDGELPVEFFYQDYFGEIEIEVMPDATWRLLAGDVAHAANWFWSSDLEVCGDDLDEVARQVVETERPPAEGSRVSVDVMRQGSQHYALRFEYLPKLRAYFEPVPAPVMQ